MSVEYVEDVSHLLRLKAAGFEPRTVIDVGVSNGEYFLECQKVWPFAKYYLFEAREMRDTTFESTLKAANVVPRTFFGTPLGASDVVQDFYQIDAGSSFYEEDTPMPKTVTQVRTQTLKRIFTEQMLDLYGPVFMKLDTQGSELDILTGMGSLVEKVEVVQCEVAFLPYNKEAPLVGDVVEYLRDWGFELYDLAPGQFRREDGALFHTDFVFVKSGSRLRDRKDFWPWEKELRGKV
jgi:FkbM family methyltransferase